MYYEKYFNLKKKPFELVPNPDFIFYSSTHKKAINYLDYGIRERIGFILLTGEVGSGKTTLIRNLIKGLDPRVTLSKVYNTKVSSEQLISMINEDFGLDVRGKDRITLLRELNDFLIDQHANNYQPVLIIDEAQNLTHELLEEVRLLSNLETDSAKLLQIILAGQPELRKTLASSDIRQLRQRIGISCHIKHLTQEETQQYILYRLEVSGNRNAVSFSEGVIDVIYKFTRGIPRLINTTCSFLLLSAAMEESRELTLDMVQEVINEIEEEHGHWHDDEEKLGVKELGDGKKDIFMQVSALKSLLVNSTDETQIELTKINNKLDNIMKEISAIKTLINNKGVVDPKGIIIL